MLGRLVLLLLQLVIGWLGAPMIFRVLPKFGQLDIFIQAVVFAILVWVIGVIGSIVLKDVAQPSTGKLTWALVVALIFAALTLVPDVTRAVAQVARGIPMLAYPLVGAVLGYALKR